MYSRYYLYSGSLTWSQIQPHNSVLSVEKGLIAVAPIDINKISDPNVRKYNYRQIVISIFKDQD